MSVTMAKLLVLPLLGLLAPMSGPQLPFAAWTRHSAVAGECPMARASSASLPGAALGTDGQTRFYGAGRRAADLLP